MTVNVQIDGLAASMASFIAMVGQKITIVDFGMIMIHNPHIPGGATDGQKTMLQKFKESAMSIYQAKTGKSDDEIDAMMQAETWMNAEEALDEGFADAILETDLSKVAADVRQVLNGQDYEKRESVLMSSEYNPVMHSFTPKTQPISQPNMKKVAMIVGLDSSASETEVENRVQELATKAEGQKAKIAEMKQELADKDAKIKDLSGKVEASVKAEATTFIEAAIKAGRVKEENKESMIENYIKDPAMVKGVLEGVEAAAPATPGSGKSEGGTLLDAVMEANKGGAPSAGDAPTMGLREMEKKEPEKLEKIRTEQPTVYATMYKEAYGKEYKA